MAFKASGHRRKTEVNRGSSKKHIAICRIWDISISKKLNFLVQLRPPLDLHVAWHARWCAGMSVCLSVRRSLRNIFQLLLFLSFYVFLGQFECCLLPCPLYINKLVFEDFMIWPATSSLLHACIRAFHSLCLYSIALLYYCTGLPTVTANKLAFKCCG